MQTAFPPSIQTTHVQLIMDNEKLIKISEVEKIIDDQFEKIPIPHQSRNIAIWHLLTASEDMVRMLFIRHIKLNPDEFCQFIDQSKYAIRHCMNKIGKTAQDDNKHPPSDTDGDAYKAATQLIFSGLLYDKQVRAVSAYHNGKAHFIKNANKVKLVYPKLLGGNYATLEVIGHGQEAETDITGIIHEWLSSPTTSLNFKKKFKKHAKISSDKITYNYDETTFKLLHNLLPARDNIIPSNFEFPWGNGKQTISLINSLLIRCAYHILTVSFVADLYNIPGGADSSLLLVKKKDCFCEDIEKLAQVGVENVKKFIEFLTFGYKTSTPDPALQPLIDAGRDEYFIPCFYVITNNLQRNLLSLFARVSQKDFDRQSALFECNMTPTLVRELSNWKYVAANKTVGTGVGREEIDVVVFDPNEKLALLFELRWMTQPGDPREISNREKVCHEKVTQLNRKINFFKERRIEYIKKLFPDLDYKEDQHEISVNGVVVIFGYGGKESKNSEIPIITQQIISIGARRIKSLTKLYEWVKSLQWLPQENYHYNYGVNEIELGDTTLEYPGIEITTDQNAYVHYIISSTEEFM